MSTELLQRLSQELQEKLGARFVLSRPEELAAYECDGCVLIKKQPELVALPRTTDEVAFVVSRCREYGIPFTARGGGTGLSGGALAMRGGVLIGLNRMNRILDIDLNNLTATVEVGVVNARLNEALAPHGLFYAPDPSSQSACTIGGNIAENAGGIHCIKYGVTSDHILGLEVVLPDGTVTWLGGQNRRSQGPNLVSLMVGSEGTLGIITKAIVRLTQKPDVTRVYLAAFGSLTDAGAAVAAIIKQGIQPSALEFMDAFTIKAVNEAFDVGFPEQAEAVLLIELDGHLLAVQEAEAKLRWILEQHHAGQLKVGKTEAERQALWKARKGTVAAYGRYLPAFYLHDCVIPRSQLVPVLKKIQQVAERYQLSIGNVFHAGDGNLHPNILFDPDDKAMVERALKGGEEILHACLAVGGTLSGEHGIGIEKAEYMGLQFSEASLEKMKLVKSVFDPAGLSNPEKIFPTRKGCGETRQGIENPMLSQAGVWV
ncbi:MAG TPA: FAD-linked oxidase C-terminal domain-containing protein [Oculatellaceae cyanobacterium]